MKTKRILVLILTFVIVCSCVSVASFAAFGGGGRESGGFVGGGRFESVSPDSLWSNVGASGLQSLCVDVNVNSDYFTFWESLGLSEHGVAGIENFSVYGESVYVIVYVKNGTRYLFCNTAGYPFYCPSDEYEAFSDIAFELTLSNNVSNFASYIRDIKNLSDRTYGYVGTLVTKITDIHTQLTDSSTSGTMAQRLKNIDSSLGTIKAILGGQQTGTMLHGMYQRIDSINTLLTNWESTVTVDTSDLENMVSQSLAVIRGISNDTTDLVTLLDPTYQGQLTTLASYIVRICEAVESADSNITVDTSALETKIDDLHNSLNPYSDLSIAEMIGDWWVETRNSFADIDSDLNAMNGYLLTIDSSCRTINTNMVNLNGYITDDLEDIYGRLTGILSAVDGDNGSLNNGFATANGHLSNIKSYTNSIKSYTNSLNTNITDIETLLTNWEHPTFDTTALESAVSTLQTSVESDFDDLGIKVDTVATNVEAVTTALGTANSHLNTSKSYLKNIQSYTSTMKTDIADIETLLTNWEHPVFDTTALEDKVVDTNDYLSQISDKLDELTESTVDNITNITITNNNDAYEVFYLTDENGKEESIAEFGGDVLTAGGKLLNFFFRVAFDDALSNIDTTVDNMTDFYFNTTTVGEGAGLWE